MPPAKRRKGKNPTRTARPRLEALEGRLLMTAGPRPTATVVGDVLSVQGTAGPDRIRILPTDQVGTLEVVANGRVLGTYGPVAKIQVNGGDGKDVIIVDPRITLPTELNGEGGSDYLQGGSGPNVLSGGSGNDVLVGTQGRDTFVGAGGRDRQLHLKQQGVIQVGASVPSAMLKRLSGTYKLMPLQAAGPAVITAADLNSLSTLSLLKNDYNGGQTVSMVNATQAQANTLAQLLGDPREVVLPGGAARVDMVSFRRIDEGGRSIYHLDFLASSDKTPTATRAQRLESIKAVKQNDQAYLTKVFNPTPPPPAPPRLGDAPNNLLQLANAYITSVRKVFPDYTGIQLENTAYGVRSFLNQVDLYYITQELDGGNSNGSLTEFDLQSIEQQMFAYPQVIQPSPLSNPGTTTITTGVNTTIGGSAGWNAAQGLNASISGGVTIVNQTSVTVPSVRISQSTDLTDGIPYWNFNPTNLPFYNGTFYTSWIWQVPFGAYGGAPTKAMNFASLCFSLNGQGNGDQLSLNMSIPAPFGGTYQLTAPTVSSVGSQTVAPGQIFTIQGTAFYPSLVQSVVIGGQPLDPANFTVVNDSQIEVVAPTTIGNNQAVIVKTSEGFSNGNITLNIAPTSGITVTGQSISGIATQTLSKVKVASFIDTASGVNAGTVTASINWGDGTTSNGVVSLSGNGVFTVLGDHAYANASTYTITVKIDDGAGNQATGTSTATIAPDTVPSGPQNLTTQDFSVAAGSSISNQILATFTDADPGVGPSSFTASIDWGDGISTPSTTVVLPGPQPFQVLGTHKYETAGKYTFTVQVTDAKGNKVSSTGTATVN